MSTNTHQRRGPSGQPRRRGVTSIIAMLMLTVFTVLAVAFAAATDMNLARSDNQAASCGAQLAAESGLSFLLRTISSVRLPGTTTAESFPQSLSAAMGTLLNGTSNLGGQSVTVSGAVVQVPLITTDDGSFQCCVDYIDANTARLTVAGEHRLARRSLSMDLAMVPRRPAVFDYGIASRGQVIVSGNADIIGVNNMAEASVLSATASAADAIHVDGNVTITGDLSVSAPDSYVLLTGTPTIAGSDDPNVIAQHIHTGVGTPDFPEINAAPLAALATNVVDSSTNLTVDSMSNIRIAAGTNPTFSSDIILNGVVYIEAPNVVRFEGKTTLNGLVVTEEKDSPFGLCELHFAGNVEAKGVEALPDTEEFADVKEQTGTFVLAPGFKVTFAGNFSAINGTIAADQLTFTGTAEGVVRGTVLGLKDLPTALGGNVDIYVDRQNADAKPAGFVESIGFQPQPSTYAELAGGI